jgi:hypothetical protein
MTTRTAVSSTTIKAKKSAPAPTAAAPTCTAEEDRQYDKFAKGLQKRFNEVIGDENEKTPIFTTTATGLFDAFLAALPAHRRQYYNCRTCQRFIDHFGGLVVVDPQTGNQVPLLWGIERVPAFFQDSVRAVLKILAKAKINGVFLSSETVYGLPENRTMKMPGIFHHMHVTASGSRSFKHALKSADQMAAEKLEDYGTLCRGLDEFSFETVKKAHALLSSGNLYRSEKCRDIALWLCNLYVARNAEKGTTRDNITWLYAASAPPGFCHVKTTMITTLLEDIEAGLPFADIKRKFDAKMNPLAYMRPQAAPTAGNLAQAEKIIAKLNAAGSLARRFAKLEDVQALWRPPPAKAEKPAGGVFGHITPKGASGRGGASSGHIDQPSVTMTWVKFLATVLPEAERIEYLVPNQATNFSALITAENPDAPPILQWDTEEKRNPVSWYLYVGGSLPGSWNLTPQTWTAVTAVALQPTEWNDPGKFKHQGESVFFLLEGAHDKVHTASGGFFVETLKNEYHEIRASLEAYAKTAVIAGRDEATACGLLLQRSAQWNHSFRVHAKGMSLTYKLDRWD